MARRTLTNGLRISRMWSEARQLYALRQTLDPRLSGVGYSASWVLRWQFLPRSLLIS